MTDTNRPPAPRSSPGCALPGCDHGYIGVRPSPRVPTEPTPLSALLDDVFGLLLGWDAANTDGLVDGAVAHPALGREP